MGDPVLALLRPFREDLAVEGRQLLAPVVDHLGGPVPVVPRDGEVARVVVHLDHAGPVGAVAAHLVAPGLRGQFAPDQDVQAPSGRRPLGVGLEPVDDSLGPRLEVAALVDAMIQVDPGEVVPGTERESDPVEAADELDRPVEG
jgi:hypothetical protein